MKWACGVCTVPQRMYDLLPQTLASLKLAGFSDIRLFVDHCADPKEHVPMAKGVTNRWPRIGSYGNWMLGMTELFLRAPDADRYVMFEDDVVLCRNTRNYVEACKFPTGGYLNLYTVPDNVEAGQTAGWTRSAQKGRGALALAFDRDGVRAILTSARCVSHSESKQRGHYLTDGAILDAMRKVGVREWVHVPSLVQHTGAETTIPNRLAPTRAEYMTAPTFPGESFDAMEFLNAASTTL